MAGPVTFLAIWLRMLISFINDVDIQLILELKNSLEKNLLVCPKNPQKFFFLGHSV